MGPIKPVIDKNYAVLTFTTEEVRDNVLKDRLIYLKKLQVSVTHNCGAGYPSEFRTNTTLVANKNSKFKTQTTISEAIKQTFGADNIVNINFGNNNQPHIDKKTCWYHIQCRNAAVYTE